MSSSMHYRPVPKDQPPPNTLVDLKRLLARRYWDHDGSLYGDPITFTITDESFIGWLEGIVAAGRADLVDEAAELLAVLRAHGAIEIWIGE